MPNTAELQKIEEVSGLVTDSYTFLQGAIFFEMMAKTALRSAPDNISRNSPPFSIEFDNGTNYVLRNDYIISALNISIENGRGLGLISQIGLIHSFSDIVSKTYELLDTRNAGSVIFETYCKNILGAQFNSFKSIVTFFRNVFLHSISREYKLKNKDFSEWKRRHAALGINEVRLNVTITNDPPQAIDIHIKLDEVVEGMSIWSVIGTGGILMLMELIMNLFFHFTPPSP